MVALAGGVDPLCRTWLDLGGGCLFEGSGRPPTHVVKTGDPICVRRASSSPACARYSQVPRVPAGPTVNAPVESGRGLVQSAHRAHAAAGAGVPP